MVEELVDNVNKPSHYLSKSVECIDITQGLPFCLGNAIKYIWRAGEKSDLSEDLEKAVWYINRYMQYERGFLQELKSFFFYKGRRTCISKIKDEFKDQRFSAIMLLLKDDSIATLSIVISELKGEVDNA